MAEQRRPWLRRLGFLGDRPDTDDGHGGSLTSSAAVVDLKDRSEAARLGSRSTRQAWQPDAWTYRRSVGEVRFLQDWMGEKVGRVRLFPAVIVDGQDVPASLDDALAPPRTSGFEAVPLPAGFVADVRFVMAQLGETGPMLSRATVNLDVVGEFYLVGYLDQEGRERWEARAVEEVVATEYGYVLQDTPRPQATGTRPATTADGGPLLDPEDSYLARVWRADAQWSGLAASPMSSVLDRCEELLLLGRGVRANARSRLSAGLLLLPNELNQDPVANAEGDLVYPVPIEQQVQTALVTPISDESAPSAVVPVTVRGPGEDLQYARVLSLGRGSTEQDAAERAEALARVLQGLDAPPELVTGFADVKYANARAISTSAYADHVEPRVLFLVHALTVVYLRARLRSLGHGDDLVDRVVVGFDPSALTGNPEVGKDALEVHKAGALSDEALLRYAGFDPERDAPDDVERARRAVERVPQGQQPAVPALPPAGRPADDDGSEPAASRASRLAALATRRAPRALTASAEAGPEAVLSDLGTRLLRVDLRLAARLQAAADAALARVLERAGNRARSKVRHTPAAAAVDGLAARDVVRALVAAGQPVAPAGELLDPSELSHLCATFEVWAAQAFEDGLRAYARALGLTFWPPSLTAAGPRGEVDVPFSDLEIGRAHV